MVARSYESKESMDYIMDCITLNDDEDFCVICEEYYDKKISNTSELEYTEKTKVDKKRRGNIT